MIPSSRVAEKSRLCAMQCLAHAANVDSFSVTKAALEMPLMLRIDELRSSDDDGDLLCVEADGSVELPIGVGIGAYECVASTHERGVRVAIVGS